MEEIEQIAREFLIHDEEAYQLHRTRALCWFERVLKQTDINQDRIKLAVQKEDVRLYHSYTTFLVLMPDPATPGSTGLSAEGTSTTATVSVQIAAYRMVKKFLARF